ncbi:hypothetical protein F4808DRAFT_457685 [Astrocystis sublimbata]|nr:hypothetical protein F4808DRAFT_457685 [Astrocystis sublimbata]
MAKTPQRSPTPERTAGEDSDTAAARKELRQTAISEKPNLSAVAADSYASPSDDTSSAAKDLMSSPKKKRAHEEVDDPKDAAASTAADGDVSPIGANGSGSLSRTDRSEPEKKRPRDVSSEVKAVASDKRAHSPADKPASGTDTKDSLAKPTDADSEKAQPTATKSDQPPAKKSTATTTASAFQSSSLSAFASQSSPFAQAGTGQAPLSSFASPSVQGGFGALSPAGGSIFGSGGNSGNASPFGQLGSAPSPFGGLRGGLTSTPFGGSGAPLASSSKPAKPFGAPASDDEDETDDEEDNNANGDDGDDDDNQDDRNDGEAGPATTGDMPKLKQQPVATNDDETSIIQARGRLFSLDKKSSSWKERGAGILRLMVPKESVVIGDDSNGLPGSFDSSAFKKSESKMVRLVMRQDATHRVILNTTLLPNMEFRAKSGLKSTSVLFTAIEDEGPISITLRMNMAQAKRFVEDIESIQVQLKSV